MAKGKPVQRKVWVVRKDSYCSEYIIASAIKRPYKRNGQWLALGDWYQTMGHCPFEHIFPQFRLPPGGGPIEMRIEEVLA